MSKRLNRILLPCPFRQMTIMVSSTIPTTWTTMAMSLRVRNIPSRQTTTAVVPRPLLPTPSRMPTLGVGAVVALILHLFRHLGIRTITTLTSHILIMPTNALTPIQLPLRSHRPTIECARRTTVNASLASHSLTLSGQRAARSAIRKARPRTRRLVTHRKAHALRGDVSAVSTLTPSLAGILLVSASAVLTASIQLVRGTPQPATTHPGRGVIPNRQLRTRTRRPG